MPAVLAAMDDLAYNFHVQGMQNDFADWIEKVYGAYDLASLMRDMNSKEEMVLLMNRIIDQGKGIRGRDEHVE